MLSASLSVSFIHSSILLYSCCVYAKVVWKGAMPSFCILLFCSFLASFSSSFLPSFLPCFPSSFFPWWLFSSGTFLLSSLGGILRLLKSAIDPQVSPALHLPTTRRYVCLWYLTSPSMLFLFLPFHSFSLLSFSCFPPFVLISLISLPHRERGEVGLVIGMQAVAWEGFARIERVMAL